jgi:RNA-directed DNA polymerase
LKDKLRLAINREKRGIRTPSYFQVLGYGFLPTYNKGEKRKHQLIVGKSKWKSFQQKLKYLKRKRIPKSFDKRIARLKLACRRLLNYFKLASAQSKIKKLDEWLRNSLRYCICDDWKRPKRKRKNLIRLGVPSKRAYAWSQTRKGGWAVAQSPILNTTITVKRLKRRGYLSLLDYYHKVKLHE